MSLGDSHGNDGECPAVCRDAQSVDSADDKGLQEIGPVGVEDALQGEHWAKFSITTQLTLCSTDEQGGTMESVLQA